MCENFVFLAMTAVVPSPGCQPTNAALQGARASPVGLLAPYSCRRLSRQVRVSMELSMGWLRRGVAMWGGIAQHRGKVLRRRGLLCRDVLTSVSFPTAKFISSGNRKICKDFVISHP